MRMRHRTVEIPADGWAKQEPLTAALLEVARDLGPEARMPTVREICREYGVSTSTLDPVLRSLEARGTIVRQHGRGIFVSPSILLKTVGVVFGGDIFRPEFSPFWGLLLRAVTEQAGGQRIEPRAYLSIARSSCGLADQRQLIEDLAAKRLDGILLIAPHYEYDEEAELSRYGIPLVTFGGHGGGWTVNIDWAPFLAFAAARLAGWGVRRVGLMGSPVHREVLAAGLAAAGAGEVRIDDWSYETWANVIPGAGTREHCVYRVAQRMIAEAGGTPLPDALVSMEDTMTRGAITALQQAGLRPGRDIRIVTGANCGSPVLEPYAGDIEHMEFDPAACVCAALRMLGTLMRGETPPGNPVLIAPHEGVGGGQSAWRNPYERGPSDESREDVCAGPC